MNAAHEAVARHAPAAPDLDVVAAREVERPVFEPPRHVEMHAAHAVVVVRHVIRHLRDEPGHVRPGRVGDVPADGSARVGEAVREQRGRGVEQQTRRLEGARGRDHDPGTHVAVLAARLVDVGDSRGAAAPVHGHLPRHRVRQERQFPGGQGGCDQHVGRGEVRVHPAAAVALPAVVTGGPAVQGARENREPRRDTGDAQPVRRLLDQQLVAARLRRREEHSVRLVGEVFLAAEDPDQPVDLVVIGRDVGVRDGPIVAQPVAGFALEVVRTEAQRDPAPVVGSAPDHAGPPPAERGAGRARVRLAGDLPTADAGVELAERTLLRGLPAARRLVGPGEHRRVRRVIPGSAGLEQNHVRAGLREHVRGHPAAGARADDTNVVARPRPQAVHTATASRSDTSGSCVGVNSWAR